MIDGLVCECRGADIAALSDAGLKLLGYRGKATPVGQPFHRFVVGDWAKKLENSLKALTVGRNPKTLTLITRSGATASVDVTAKTLSGGRVLILATSRPATPEPVAPKLADEPQRVAAETLVAELTARTRELQELSRQSRQIVESASDGILAVDLEGRIKTANPSAGELFDRSHIAMSGLPVERVFLHGSGHLNAGQPVPVKAQMAAGPFHADIEVSLARTDGSSFDAAYVIAPISENRQVSGYVITVRDVTERKKMAAEQRVASAVFDQSADGLLVADARGRVLKVNPAFTRLTDRKAAELIGQPMNEAMQAEPKLYREAMESLQKQEHAQWEQWLGEQWVGEKWVGGKRAGDKETDISGDKPGKRRAWRIGISMIRDERGRAQQYAAIVSDVTGRKLEEERILYQANYDQLTGLPNRTLFNDRLQRVVLEGRRGKTNVGLMFIDLDGFKAINDNLGHDAGDLLLQATAERLNKSVRESDTVARLGGDEFTVIMPLLDSFDGAALVANRILKSLTTPFDLNGQEGRVSASIGISMFPAQCDDAQQLLHNADVAMYHAKRHGKANFQIWRQELEAGAEARY
jgi:diguanylate cyclase (GGDEF)-like protein/PAS domain S-box-containing protein